MSAEMYRELQSTDRSYVVRRGGRDGMAVGHIHDSRSAADGKRRILAVAWCNCPMRDAQFTVTNLGAAVAAIRDHAAMCIPVNCDHEGTGLPGCAVCEYRGHRDTKPANVGFKGDIAEVVDP